MAAQSRPATTTPAEMPSRDTRTLAPNRSLTVLRIAKLERIQRLEMVRALTSAVQALGAGLPQHVR